MLRVVEQEKVIFQAEEIGNGDVLRALGQAVVAVGAGDLGLLANDLRYLPDDLQFLLVQGLEVLHGLYIVFYLCQGAHAAHDPVHTGGRCGKADGPAGNGGLRVVGLHQCLCLRRDLGKQAALAWLHDEDILPVLLSYLAHLAGGDGGIVPIQIVDLKVHKIDFRVIRQHLLQKFRVLVGGSTEPTDHALLDLFVHILKAVDLLGRFIGGPVDAVHQVGIKVVHMAVLKLLLKNIVHLFDGRVFDEFQRHFRGNLQLLPGIAVYHALSHKGFTFVAVVDPGGIEVIESGINIPVHHFIYLGRVHAARIIGVQQGQAHKTEAKFFPIVSSRHIWCSFHGIS